MESSAQPDPALNAQGDLDRGAATRLLTRMRAGDDAAAAQFYDLLWGELRRLAAAQLRRAPGDRTLQPTALVNEAWLRLGAAQDCRDREHFLAVAARAMRSVLVDAMRRRASEKRGGGAEKVPLDDVLALYQERALDLLEFDDALERLGQRNTRQAKLVELRFFGGLSTAESARVLGVSPATADRDWHLARIWLRQALAQA